LKIFSLFVAVFFFYKNTFAQAVVSRSAFVKSILDFGAIPDDSKDDTWAFIKAGSILITCGISMEYR